MRFYLFTVLALLLIHCKPQTKPAKSHYFTAVKVKPIIQDSTLSVRAIEFLNDNTLAFAGANGIYGTVDTQSDGVKLSVQYYDSITPNFRAVGHTATDFFMLSIANPALLFKTGNTGKMELVYKEEGEGVFYDAMRFWNDAEGIAIGDRVKGCLSILITRDGGHTWQKVPCSDLPPATEGEGAFAASNTNIEIKGSKTWIATTGGRIYFSGDKGCSWEIFETPIIKGTPAEGIYSLDFYNDKVGFAIGGDYTKPDENIANKMSTEDGGKTWQLMANGQAPGYKSCVQFVPNSGGDDLVAIGFTGISYSNDKGQHWKTLSEEGFYTIRFLNDSVAYAAGKGRIVQLLFSK